MYAHERQAYEMHAYEGFCEDLARQNTVAYLSQLQLRFRCRRIWVPMLSHMGFSRRRGADSGGAGTECRREWQAQAVQLKGPN
jgi:hypothetical protein